jgi:septum formation protein
MQQLGLQFTVQLSGEIDELYPPELQREEIPLFLARLKSDAFFHAVAVPDDTIVITADTIVWINEQVLGKPSGRQEAIDMLKILSGNMHQVYTGVYLATNSKKHAFFDESKVYFRPLTIDEISFYVDRCQPYDKAGAYGIQEWIGYVGIEKIDGSHYNVMGLPIQKLYCELCDFLSIFAP